MPIMIDCPAEKTAQPVLSVLHAAGAAAAPPQAANNILAAITSEIKTNKRLDISYSSEYYFLDE
jgi:hypothetical protein